MVFLSNKIKRNDNGDYTLILKRRNGITEISLFSPESLKIVQRYHWVLLDNGRKKYVRSSSSVMNGWKDAGIFLHNVIMKRPKGYFIDHVNGNELDNRINNLRIANVYENAQNCKTRRNNTSGHRGISHYPYNNYNKKWNARIGYYGKRYSLGYFETIEEAIEARKKAEIKYYGKFNHQS